MEGGESGGRDWYGVNFEFSESGSPLVEHCGKSRESIAGAGGSGAAQRSGHANRADSESGARGGVLRRLGAHFCRSSGRSKSEAAAAEISAGGQDSGENESG